ncbi:MAG: hypothetical protein RI580_06715 [Halothece sp. Uz-M2-17]|nr:hypothetical protein [Halothece sp. Uz-M2-17]
MTTFHPSETRSEIFYPSIELCRDTNAALNILKKGMELLGMEWSNNSTQGHWETASKGEKTGETSASANEGKSELVSGVAEPVTTFR